jgi:Rrf2 family protein
MISQTAEYALRAIVHLAAREAGEPPTTVQISQAAKVPAHYLAKVLRSLSRAGLVQSQRGPGGGHVLRRDPRSLTVLEVVNAVDPLPRIEACPLGLKEHQDLCPLHRRLDSATALVAAAFEETTIAELLPRRARGKASCQFPCFASSGRVLAANHPRIGTSATRR